MRQGLVKMASLPIMERGQLRIYVGYAPGVGKTYAMLDEARRRRDRGTDVVIASLEPHGREQIRSMARGLPTVPSDRGGADGRAGELDLDELLARQPAVAVVDELAHANAPASRHATRVEDVEALLAAGIDVIATVNIQHLASLRDVIEAIVGAAPADVVPDAVVRGAEQLELVDMTPQSLLRRLAHGNVFPPERMDAATAQLFQEHTLARLREIALIWMADRVDEELRTGPAALGADGWSSRERILVGVGGQPGDDALIRRAARMAGRRGGELLVVHVAADRDEPTASIDTLRSLTSGLGGRFEVVTAPRVPDALLEMARAEGVTQIVLGTSDRSRLGEFLRGSAVHEVIRASGFIDVHVISRDTGPARSTPGRRREGGLSTRRQLLTAAVGGLVLLTLTVLLVSLASRLALSTVMLLFLTAVVGVAFGGGLRPAATAAIASVLLINWFFTPPVHTWKIADPEDLVALLVFLVVAASVSVLVNRDSRHRAEVRRRRAEAEAITRLAADAAEADDPLPELVESLRSTFGSRSVAVFRPTADGWRREAAAGEGPSEDPADADQSIELEGGSVLAITGDTLPASSLQLLSAFAAQLSVAMTSRALAREAADAEALAEIDSLRTTILAAVSHDLRTPLASIKASVSSLRDEEIAWSATDSAQFLETIEDETDRLTELVANLLDMSRLQVGALSLVRDVVGFDEIVPRALASLPGGGRDVVVDVPESLPRVDADPGLLERAVANLTANARAWSPAAGSVRIQGSEAGGRVELRVVDRGPGLPRNDRARMFEPFQRLGARAGGEGLGLGLAVARGFVEAMGGDIVVEDTPGGGLTMVIGFRAVAV
jgi:two-component system sensor histidine kinase KdpD